MLIAFCLSPDDVNAQLPDLAIVDLRICESPEGGYFRVFIDIGHEADFVNYPESLITHLRISIDGPATTVPDDNQLVTMYYPPNPNAGCDSEDPPGCDSGSCQDWYAIAIKGSKTTAYEVNPSCIDFFGACECVYGEFTVEKPTEKHDGPGEYFFSVTIDPNEIVAESDESNNSMTVAVEEGSSCCAAVMPTSSDWSLLVLGSLLLGTGAIFVINRMRLKSKSA